VQRPESDEGRKRRELPFQNLFDRPVVAAIFTRAEMLEIAEDRSTSAAALDADEEA
jgi:hypothetical protein